MKKLSSIIMLAFALLLVSSCSNDSKIKKLVSEDLSKQMKNPESFKITSIEIREDTVPVYFKSNVQSALSTLGEASSAFNRYAGMSDLFAKEKAESLSELSKSIEDIKALTKNMSPEVKKVAYVRYTAKTGIGVDKQGAAIVILSDDKDPKIEGTFFVDNSDFTEKFVSYKLWVDEQTLKQNDYGKIETANLPYIEKFILSGEE